ncbi:MAG: hypothetical protein JWP12_3183 [Bacteroidetes bacterium]|nr:hypothetical protein [Bacteroidota bacterium]
MKKIIAATLFLFFTTCFFSVKAQTRDAEKIHNMDFTDFSLKDSTRYKKAVAAVITPDYRQYTTGYGKHHTTHYISYMGFLANDIEVRDEVEDGFLYFSSSKGDRFTVLYDSVQPHHFRIVTSEPQLDPGSRIDTTIVTVSSIDAWGTEVRFKYVLNNSDSIKAQDLINNNFLYNLRPDITRGRKFKAAYNTKNPDKPILLLNYPVDLDTYHFKPHNNMIGLTTLPLSKMELAYQRIVWKKFAIGLTGTVYFDPFHEANFFANGGKRTERTYTDDYFNFKNAYSIAPQIKYYIYNNAPMTFYVKVQGSYLSTQVKANYFNVSGVPKDTTGISFLSLDPSNKVQTMYKTVNAFGIQSGGGCGFFMGNSYRWVWDIGLGFQYYFYPDHLKTSKVIDATTYYYHDSPAWDGFFNFPMYMEMNVYYKF